MVKIKLMLLGSIFLLVSCSSVPSNETADVNNRSQVASKTFGGDFHFYYIPSQGAIADATFITLSQTSGPSAMAQQLAILMSKGVAKKTRIVVSGPNNTKTAIVIKNAAKLNESKKLSFLELMYLGSKFNEVKLRKIITELDSKFYFDEY